MEAERDKVNQMLKDLDHSVSLETPKRVLVDLLTMIRDKMNEDIAAERGG